MKNNTQKPYKFDLHAEFDKGNFEEIISKFEKQKRNSEQFLSEEEKSAVRDNAIHRKRSAISTVQVNNKKETLLHRFASHESRNAMQYFVRVLNFGESADINNKTSLGLRPIHYAVLSEKSERVASLVRMGANVGLVKDKINGLVSFAKKNNLNNDIISYLQSDEFKSLVTTYESKANEITNHNNSVTENKLIKQNQSSILGFMQPKNGKEARSQEVEDNNLSRTNTVTSTSSGISGIASKISSAMFSLGNSSNLDSKTGIERWLNNSNKKTLPTEKNSSSYEVVDLTVVENIAKNNSSSDKSYVSRQNSLNSSSSATSSEEFISQEAHRESNSSESTKFVSALQLLRNEDQILKNSNNKYKNRASGTKSSRSSSDEENRVITVYDLSDSENFNSNISRYESPLPSKKRLDTKNTPDRFSKSLGEKSTSLEVEKGAYTKDQVKIFPQNLNWASRIQDSSSNKFFGISR